ncbi:MAG: phosphate/phosphite/phosphonate ABC transporter substrate-binding protein [Kordiimonas sp.]
MIRRLGVFTSFFIWIFASNVAFPVAERSQVSEFNDNRFVIGRISAHPDAALTDLRAMSSYLRTALPVGEKIAFDEIVVSSLTEMAPLLRDGMVDLISETPIGAVELEQRVGAEIILHEWKKGVAQYAGLIIVHRDSGIGSLRDLRGRVVAFEDPGSTSGFFIPMAALKKEGINTVELTNRYDRPPEDVLGYVFAGVELNIASLVARKIVDAGAISDLNWNDLKEVPAGFKERLNVIFTSDFVPRSTVVVRPGLAEGVKAQLVEAFVDMHKTEEGVAAMKKYHGVARYKKIEGQLASQFNNVRTLHQRIQGFIK